MKLSNRFYKESAVQFEIKIDDLSTDGRGVGRVDGKIYFVSDALPGETVIAAMLKKKRQYNEAQAIEILDISADRVEPKCEVFGRCGGCALQHLDAEKQIHYKLNWLTDCLKKFVSVEPEQLLEPIVGPKWNYRNKARLGARYVHKKEKVLVGFRERNSSFLTEMHQCEILAEPMANQIDRLADLFSVMSTPDRIPQVEVAIAENKSAIIIRHLEPLTEDDLIKLKTFEQESQLEVYLQPKGPDTIHSLTEEKKDLLRYQHKEFKLTLEFHPSDFTQVNPAINEKMVKTAIEWLDIQAEDQVLDLFCGIGNFSLPCATKAKKVVGIEGSEAMVAKCKHNAKLNNLSNLEFYAANLQENEIISVWMKQSYEKILLDPPRSGALEVIKQLDLTNTKRIVYVSCHPASLARDAGLLVNELGFKMKQATVLDMFPHTAHVESMALFEK